MTKLRFDHGICLFPLGWKSGGSCEKTRRIAPCVPLEKDMKEPVGAQQEDLS